MAKKYIVQTEHQLKQTVVEDKSAQSRAKKSFNDIKNANGDALRDMLKDNKSYISKSNTAYEGLVRTQIKQRGTLLTNIENSNNMWINAEKRKNKTLEVSNSNYHNIMFANNKVAADRWVALNKEAADRIRAINVRLGTTTGGDVTTSTARPGASSTQGGINLGGAKTADAEVKKLTASMLGLNTAEVRVNATTSKTTAVLAGLTGGTKLATTATKQYEVGAFGVSKAQTTIDNTATKATASLSGLTGGLTNASVAAKKYQSGVFGVNKAQTSLGNEATKTNSVMGRLAGTYKTVGKSANKAKIDSHGFFSTLKRASVTVPAFYGMAKAIMAVHDAVGSAFMRTIEFDKATRTLAAVLSGQSLIATRKAAKEFNNLSTVLGGAVSDYEEASLLLARSGIGDKHINDLSKAVEITAQLSLITGESLELAASSIITFKQAYSKGAEGAIAYGGSLEEIGNKIAYMANASKLSLQDIGTFSNYAVSAGKAAGLTQDALNGMAIAFSNAGNKASTIGTQIRRFTATLTSERDGVKKLYESIGVNRTKLNNDLQKSKSGLEVDIRSSNEAFKEFVLNVAALDQVGYNQATAGMAILDKQFFDNLRNNSNEILSNVETSFGGVSDALDKTGIMADSLGNRWEAMGNKMLLGSEGVVTSISEIGTSFAEVTVEAGAFFANLVTFDWDEAMSHAGALQAIGEMGVLRGRFKDLQNESAFASKERLKDINIEANNILNIVTLTKQRVMLEKEQATASRFSLATMAEAGKFTKERADQLELVNAKLVLANAKGDIEKLRAKEIVDILKDKIKAQRASEESTKRVNGLHARAIFITEKSMQLTKDNVVEFNAAVKVKEEELKIEAKLNLLRASTKEDMSSTKAYIELASTEEALVRITGHIDTNTIALHKFASNITEINGLNDESLKQQALEIIGLTTAGNHLEANKKQNELVAKIKKNISTQTEEEKIKSSELLAILTNMDPVLTEILRYAGLITDETNKAADAADRMSRALGESVIKFKESAIKLRVANKEISEIQGATLVGDLKSIEYKKIAVGLTKQIGEVAKGGLSADEKKLKVGKLNKQRLDAERKANEAIVKAKKDIENINSRLKGTPDKQASLAISIALKQAEINKILIEQEAAKNGMILTKNQLDAMNLDIALAQRDAAKEAYDIALAEQAKAGTGPRTDLKVKGAELKLEQSKLKLIKAQNKSALDLAMSMKKAGESFFDSMSTGDVKGAFKGLTQDILKEFIKPVKESFSTLFGNTFGGIMKKMTDSFSDMLGTSVVESVAASNEVGMKSAPAAVVKGAELGGWYGMAAMAAVVAALGFGVGSFTGSEVSQADIDAATGRTDYDDDSLANLGDIFETVMYPMLDVTNKMHKHIRSMDNNFASVARAITGTASTAGVDLTGVNFVDTLEEGFAGFSSKSVSLISTGLAFELESLGDILDNASVSVRGYTTTLVEESSWWGLSSSSSIQKTFQNLPADIVEDMAGSFIAGFDLIMDAGTLLGLDPEALAESLRAYDIDLGDIDFTGLSPEEVSDRLSQAFSTAFSGAITSIDAFEELIDRYAQGSEYATETLTRIAIEYDQASHMFGLIGKDFEDAITETVVEMTTTSLVWVPYFDDISSWWGGWWTGFAGTFEAVTSTFTVVTQDIYTAQMQMLDIVESAGGLESFTDAMSAFMTSFYTEEEQLAFLTQSMAESFSTLGVVMPETNDEFRNLLETMDTSTEEGAYLYGQVLLLAEGFAAMTDAAEALVDTTDYIAIAIEAIGGISDAWLSELSYLTNAQKTIFAEAYADLALEEESPLSAVDATRAAAETALKTTTTKEEYIPVFDRYIAALEAEVPEATLDDVLSELREITLAVKELEDTTIRITP